MNNPKEKANQLIEKFLPEIRSADRYNYNIESMSVFIAKDCALIAVNEIINTLTDMCEETGNDPFESPLNRLDWWEKVKTEIEKL